MSSLGDLAKVKKSIQECQQEQLTRIEEKVDKLHLVMSELLFMLQEDSGDPELPETTLDGTPAGAPREEGQSLG